MRNESGQALLGGLFFLMIVMTASVYFIFVSKSVRELYSNTLRARFDTIEDASKYANILNEISINNHNILASVMTAQKAFISAIETGITISYEQPYWQTYSKLQTKFNGLPLSDESFSTIEKSFSSYALASGRGLFVAKALSEKNKLLILKLPAPIQKLMSQSTNTFVHCLSLEVLANNLKFVNFPVPNTYQFAMTKKDCSLEHKPPTFQKLMSTALPSLISQESDFILSFQKIDDYFRSGSTFDYGISYVKPEFSQAFVHALKFDVKGTLKSTVRISHPKFSCKNRLSLQGSFTIEEDWATVCELAENQFLQSFFKPNWASLVTHQDTGLKLK